MNAFESMNEFKPSVMRESIRESRIRESRSRESFKRSDLNGNSPSRRSSMIRGTYNSTSFDLFTKLPPESEWLKRGLVERQTSATDSIWQLRVITVTADDVLFSKQGSEDVVDRIALRNIIFVGKVRLLNLL